MNLPDSLLATLQAHFPEAALATGMAERLSYAYDNSRRNALPDAVVFPTTHEQVEALVRDKAVFAAQPMRAAGQQVA